jgi:hypothetical protein
MMFNRQSVTKTAASDDQQMSGDANLDPGSRSFEPTPAVKVRTDAQRARISRNLQKLTEKKKAKQQLVNEQQYQLAM